LAKAAQKKVKFSGGLPRLFVNHINA